MRFLPLVIVLFLLTGCWVEDLKPEPSSKTESSAEEGAKQLLVIGNQRFFVEIANTSAQRQQGLMHRQEMLPNHGMLFVWKDVAPRNFWMKNTFIPLDMIWLDAKKTIVDIQAAEPCKVENCPIYSGKAPAKYVLELNQGVLRAQVGEVVEF